MNSNVLQDIQQQLLNSLAGAPVSSCTGDASSRVRLRTLLVHFKAFSFGVNREEDPELVTDAVCFLGEGEASALFRLLLGLDFSLTSFWIRAVNCLVDLRQVDSLLVFRIYRIFTFRVVGSRKKVMPLVFSICPLNPYNSQGQAAVVRRRVLNL